MHDEGDDAADPAARYLLDVHGFVLTHAMLESGDALNDPLTPILRAIRDQAAAAAGRRREVLAADEHIAQLISLATDCRARLEFQLEEPQVLRRPELHAEDAA